MSALDPNYQLMQPLQQILFDPTTGDFLSAGIVKFFSDTNRTVPKDVYALSANPPYTYVNQGPVLTLGSIGQFLNNTGSTFTPYLWVLSGTPSAPGDVTELYYIEVYTAASGGTGTPAWTIQGWPGPSAGGSSTSSLPSDINQITNPQFVETFLGVNKTITVSVNGSNIVTPVGPNWNLITSSAGASSVQITQTPVTFTGVDGNPPYALTFNNWTGSITSAYLQQTLTASPNLFAGKDVNVSICVASNDSTSHAFYVNFISPTAVSTLVAQGSSPADDSYFTISGIPAGPVVTLPAATASPAPDSSILSITLPVSTNFNITNIQLVGVGSTTASVPFIEQSTNLQVNNLFNYYEAPLSFKPIKSYLTGWDFPLNPAQLGSSVAAAATGANTAYYIWDQTILFQTVTSSVNVTRSTTDKSLLLTMAATGQVALIQYLTGTQMSTVLNQLNLGQVSVNVRMKSNESSQYKVSLWWTTNASAPAIGSNLSVVSTLDSTGTVTPVAGWTEIKREGYPDATFTPADSEYHDYGFNLWTDTTDFSGATFFAIVVSSASITNAKTVNIQSISLVPGSVPTIPAPQTADEVLSECEAYYEMSFPGGAATNPVTGTYPNYDNALTYVQGFNGANLYPSPVSIIFKTIKIHTPAVTVYDPHDGTANKVTCWYILVGGLGSQGDVNGISFVAPAASPFWYVGYNPDSITTTLTVKGITYGVTVVTTLSTLGSNVGSAALYLQFVADSRIGTY